MRVTRLIGHNPDIFTANAVTPEIIGEINGFLIKHHQLARLVVRTEHFIGIVHFIDAFPATTCVGFHEGREADMGKNTVPIHVTEVPK